ncbi:MAG: hypothetical protein J3K34DRAFT_438096 [Monoraphidium minutum]|nr:MAG: hypothetical protein J3K34DRAFT_438096 [Monoraphidium minutum]
MPLMLIKFTLWSLKRIPDNFLISGSAILPPSRKIYILRPCLKDSQPMLRAAAGALRPLTPSLAALRAAASLAPAAASMQQQQPHHHHQRQQRRAASALTFAEHGEPEDVLQLVQAAEGAAAPPGPRQVSLELIAAPINPSDINTIQGKYPLKPPLPGVPGHEGVMRVAAAGAEVRHLRPGDRAVPLLPALGTWRSGGLFDAAGWHAVPEGLSDDAAATLCINPPSALCMLEHFVDLKAGDVVAQNGATSAVGQHVIQLCKARGIHTVNIIRDRPDWDATVAWLRGMGADVVASEQQCKQELAQAGLPPPALGLNCVGGSAALAVAKLLRPGGTVVTYGAMALQPVPLPAALLIFKDLSFRGFWLSGGWAAAAGPAARRALLDRVAALYQGGALAAPRLQTFPLSRWREALAANATAHRNSKVALAAG